MMDWLRILGCLVIGSHQWCHVLTHKRYEGAGYVRMYTKHKQYVCKHCMKVETV